MLFFWIKNRTVTSLLEKVFKFTVIDQISHIFNFQFLQYKMKTNNFQNYPKEIKRGNILKMLNTIIIICQFLKRRARVDCCIRFAILRHLFTQTASNFFKDLISTKLLHGLIYMYPHLIKVPQVPQIIRKLTSLGVARLARHRRCVSGHLVPHHVLTGGNRRGAEQLGGRLRVGRLVSDSTIYRYKTLVCR